MRTSDNQQLILDLFRAYFDARKNKRQTANALAFEADYESKLFALYDDIVNRRYEIGKSICFMVKKPVKREVFAADFRDRIVHHLIFNAINPIFEKDFIKDSYSCRVGKGTSYGIKRVDHFIRSCSENYQKECWILKLDISGYFMSMNRDILYAKIEKKLQHHYRGAVSLIGDVSSKKAELDLLLYLIKKVVYNDPTGNCLVKGSRQDWVGMPKSKSLFFAAAGTGFPIGNLTSQLFGNIYLDDFDHFVKAGMNIRYYGRYVDDMVFMHADRDRLKDAVLSVGRYLEKELGLKLHPKKKYLQYFHKGVSFLGTFIKPGRIYIGKRTKANFYRTMRVYNGMMAGKSVLGKEEVGELLTRVNSYLGLMMHYETFRLRKRMIGFLDNAFLKYVDIAENFEKILICQEGAV